MSILRKLVNRLSRDDEKTDEKTHAVLLDHDQAFEELHAAIRQIPESNKRLRDAVEMTMASPFAALERLSRARKGEQK